MSMIVDDNIEGRVCWDYEVCPYFCHSQPQWCDGSATSRIPRAFRYISLRLAKIQCIKWTRDSTVLEKLEEKNGNASGDAEICMGLQEWFLPNNRAHKPSSPSSHHSHQHFSVCLFTFLCSLQEKISKMITLQAKTSELFSNYGGFTISGTPWREVTNGPEFQFQPRTLKILQIAMCRCTRACVPHKFSSTLNIPWFTQ